MKTMSRFVALECVAVLMFAGSAWTQEENISASASQPQAGSATAVPRLVRFSGVVKDPTGAVPDGTMTLTFSLYELQQGGTPVWAETQKVQLDKEARYSALLGATQPDGLPLDVFTSGKALWLGVQPQLPGAGEQPRVLMVAVPYALKAADADTLGGKPASAYITSETLSVPAIAASVTPTSVGVQALAQTLPTLQANPQASGASPLTSSCTSITADGTAPANAIAKFSAACQIHQSSVLSETSGTVGVAGVLRLPPTGAATASLGANSRPVDLLASSFNSTLAIPINQHFRWQAEPVGNNSPSPSGKLNLLFGVGNTTPGETGLSVSNKGIITFASGQTLPSVTGNETVTGTVTATRLISTVKTGTAPLSVTSQTLVPNLNASLLGGKPAGAFATLGSNTFVGNQSVTGKISASGNMSASGSITAGTITAGSVTAGNSPFGGSAPMLGSSSTSDGVDGATTGPFNGVYGENSHSPSGIGVLGLATGQQGFGVDGGGIGVDGIGVTGTGGSGDLGTLGHSILGTAPIGVIGDSTNGYAVVATSDNSNALLVENGSASDTAVISNLGSGAPLFASGQGGSLFFDAVGNLTVSGAIYAAAKHFKIDHPLDPANKYLHHASVESSEMMNIYSGTAWLDPSGSATVSLPDWFEAVNGDFRYQLTAIGEPAPNLHIAREISNNQFVIAGGQPGMKVSWQVTGVRHDPYAQAHPLQVSVEKPEEERGYYIHPELYGEKAEKSLASTHMMRVIQRVKQK